KLAAIRASPPPGTYPPGVQPPTPQYWSPTVPADPLARRTYVNPPNYSQYAAQIERARAQQAALGASETTTLTPGRIGGGIVLAVASITLPLHALKVWTLKGEELPCIPDTPEWAQVCNPALDFWTGELKQELKVKQINPERDPNDILGPLGFGP